MFLFLAFMMLQATAGNPVPARDTITTCGGNVPPPSGGDQLSAFFAGLFRADDWPARWQCGSWTPFHGWLYIGADVVIWLAYFMIPGLLLYYLHRRSSIKSFRAVLIMFVAFILACGLTHLMDAVIFWWPAYRLSALLRLITAGVSLGTVLMLVRVIPKALEFRSPDDLERLVALRTTELQAANESLEREVSQRRKAEEEVSRLNKSLSDFRNAIHLASIVSVADAEGRITFVNDNFVRISGYRREELLGNNHRIVNSRHHPPAFWKHMWETVGAGQTWRQEVKNRAKDGSYYWVDTFIIPFTENGRVIEYLSIRNDITTRKEAEDNLLRMKAHLEVRVQEKTADLQRMNEKLLRTSQIVESLQRYAHIGVWELDLDKQQAHWTDEVFDIHEMPARDVVSLEEGINFYRPDDVPMVRKAVQRAIEHGEPWDLELRLVTFRQNEKWVRSIGLPEIRDGRVVALKGLLQNIDSFKLIEETLRTQKEINSLAIEAGDIGVFSWEVPTGRIEWNAVMFKHFGVAPEAFTGFHDDFLYKIHPDDIPLLARARETDFEGETRFTIEYRVILASGRLHYITTMGIVFRHPGGTAERVVGICLNNTERRLFENRLLESEERFRSALVHSAVGMALVGTDGRWLEVNQALLDILGYQQEEILTLTFQAITHPEDLQADMQFVEEMLDGRRTSYQMEKRYIHRKGYIVWAQLNVSMVRDKAGTPLYFIAQIQDITLRLKSEQEIRDINTTLEARTRNLEVANQELESFTYSVSHDLRAPLRFINGYAEVLREEHADQLNAEGLKCLQTIIKNALKMGQLIDDLLEFSRIGRTGINLNWVDTYSLIETLRADLLELEKDRKIELIVHPLEAVKADFQLFRQVWINLLSNAIKYTRKRADARIEVGSSIQDNEVIFYVKDNGVGFNMDYIHKLFEVFQRLHRADEFEGTGVGLALVKRIITRHHGRIWAEAQQNEGATFYFTLPR